MLFLECSELEQRGFQGRWKKRVLHCYTALNMWLELKNGGRARAGL